MEEQASADIGAAIASGAGDIGIASDAVLSDALQKFPFRTDRLVLVMPRGDEMAKRRQVRFRDVITKPFVGLARDSALQLHIAGHAARLGVTMQVRVRVGGFDAVCRMVETGVGVAIVPEAAAKRCRHSMRIAWAALAEEWATRRLTICVRQLQTLPLAARRLVEHLL